VNIPTSREQQLAEIRRKVEEWRGDAAKCQGLASASRRQAEEHEADAARAAEMAERWAAVGRGVLLNVIPDLDECPVPSPDSEVPF
jgi:hypothetical protein